MHVQLTSGHRKVKEFASSSLPVSLVLTLLNTTDLEMPTSLPVRPANTHSTEQQSVSHAQLDMLARMQIQRLRFANLAHTKLLPEIQAATTARQASTLYSTPHNATIAQKATIAHQPTDFRRNVLLVRLQAQDRHHAATVQMVRFAIITHKATSHNQCAQLVSPAAQRAMYLLLKHVLQETF